MNNPRIGQLANILTRAEDSGRTDTDAYRAARAEYDALKAAPENWGDVPAAKRTPEQTRLAAAWEIGEEPGALANGSGATFCLHEADGDSAPLVAARIVDLFAANGLATLRAISALDVGQRETFGGASRSAIAVSRLT